MGLSAAERATLREILERERNKLVRRLHRFGTDMAQLEVGGFSQHMAEDASALSERETAYLLASEEGRRLVAVRQALDRLNRYPDEFGICHHCNREIGFPRMEAVPYTELCIECKTTEEERGSGRRD